MFSLKELFGRDVKVTYEEDYQSDSERPKEHFMIIKGKRGLIYPYSDTEVVVETTNRIGLKLLKLFKDRASQLRSTDEGLDIILPVEMTRLIWKYIKPKKVRHLTEASKEALRSRLATYRALKTTV